MSDSKDLPVNCCEKCGQPMDKYASVLLVTSINEKAKPKCPHCAAQEHALTFTSIQEADEFISDTMEMLDKLERIIAKIPEMPEVPKELQPSAMTPLSVYRTLQVHLAAFKCRRLEMITEAGSQERLEYEIQKAVGAEEYERAAELKKQQDESQG